MNKASQFSKLNFFDTELNKTKLKSFVGSLSVFCITLTLHCILSQRTAFICTQGNVCEQNNAVAYVIM